MAPVTYIELGDEPVVTEDWPDNSASVEGQTAEAAFGITGELATAKADDLATWAKAKADETTWSCDGRRGYAWGFFTPDVSLYRFRGSRGAAVAAAQLAFADSVSYSGQTEPGEYEISTLTQLTNFTEAVRDYSYDSARYYKITADE